MACPAAERRCVAPQELRENGARLPSLNRAVRALLPESSDRECADCLLPACHHPNPEARRSWAQRVVGRHSSGADRLWAEGPLLAEGLLLAGSPPARGPCSAVDFGCYSAAA